MNGWQTRLAQWPTAAVARLASAADAQLRRLRRNVFTDETDATANAIAEHKRRAAPYWQELAHRQEMKRNPPE